MMKYLLTNKKLLIALMFILMMPFAQASLIFFDPQESNAQVGELIYIDIIISELTPNETVGGFDFGLDFDTRIVSLAGVSFYSNSFFNGWDDLFPYGAGKVNIWDVFDDVDYNATSLSLVTLSFNALAVGTTDLTILFDYNFSGIVDDLGSELFGVARENGRINVTNGANVTTVSEPSSTMLLWLGLLFIIRNRLFHLKFYSLV